MQHIPFHSALLAKNTIFDPKKHFFPQSTPEKVRKSQQILIWSHLGTHDEAFLWHHIYMTEQSHDSFTWRLKSMTYRYITINYMKSNYMTLYLHKQHLHDGSLVWNPLIWLNYSFTWQMFTWQTLTWCFPSITWHSFA